MYLLTWHYTSFAGSSLFSSKDVAMAAYDVRTGQEPELFERRGNDWIRIRPEAE